MKLPLLLALGLSLHTVSALKFLSIGDWGDEAMTASGLAKFFNEEAEGAPLGLVLGDNFYEAGVKSVDDPQWKKKYLDVFSGKNLEKMRFLVAGGNHDYYGNITAQIAYTQKDPTKRWMFPSFYHARYVEQNNIKMFVVVLDTWRLNGGDTIFGHDPRTGNIWLRSKEELKRAVVNGDISAGLAAKLEGRLLYQPEHPSLEDEEQYKWIRRALTSKSALDSDWRIVMGHYPIRSASKHEHGDTPSLVKKLDGLLRELNVDAYFSGHDHILQVSHRGGSLHYYGSGAGGKRHPDVHENYAGLKGSATGTFGFMKHEATKTTLKTTFVVSIGPGLGGEKNYAFEYIQEKSKKEEITNHQDVFVAQS